jgi:hypothetical protein
MAINPNAVAVAAEIAARNGLWGIRDDPYLWVSVAAVFTGLALGQAARAFLPYRGPEARAARRRSGRVTRAIAFLSFGILSVAALLVMADKGALAVGITKGGAVPGAGALMPWAAVVAGLAFVAGMRPLAAGIPLVCAALAVTFLAHLALEDWLPLRATAAGGSVKVAELLPYEVGPTSFRGHLELSERAAKPAAQELALGSDSVGITVETLVVAGPVAFLARVVMPTPRVLTAVAPRFYRVVGIAAPGGAVQAFSPPANVRLLDTLLPLAPGAGLEPGAAAVSSGVSALARRSRQTSAPSGLVALEPVSFGLGDDGVPAVMRGTN